MPDVSFDNLLAVSAIAALAPLLLGFVIAFWAAPIMTLDRLAIAVLLTVYIVTALVFEEHDLIATFGDEYRRYQQSVPRLFPKLWSH